MPNFIKLAAKFKSELRQQYKDSMSYPDAAEIADLKRRGGDHPREAANKAFSYIEKSKNPTQAKNRAEEMFGDFDVDGAIEEAGGFDKAFKIIKPVKKAGGGIAKGARTAKKVAEAVERRAKAANRKKDKAKEAEKKDKRKAMALAGATGATLAGATVIGAKKEKERLEKIKNKKDGGWIQKAIKKPGALKKQLGVPKDEKIPAKKLNAAAKKGGKLGQRARLAKTLRGFKDGGVVTKWENKWG